MPVISTFSALRMPTTAPMETAPTSRMVPRVSRASPSSGLTTEATVAIRASAMPRMPNALPRLEVWNRLSPASAKMNSSPETM